MAVFCDATVAGTLAPSGLLGFCARFKSQPARNALTSLACLRFLAPMERQYYLDLAAAGLRMPIGTDLVLHEQPDPAAVLSNGERLGQVVAEAARRYRTPLAFAHMDLEVEKAALLSLLQVPADRLAKYHFDECPSDELMQTIGRRIEGPLDPKLQAQVEAVAYVARQSEAVPVGMCIGPFSLMTKLLADPITPIFLAGSGATADEEAEVKRLERVLDLAFAIVQRSITAKIQAGAKAICIAEPAANRVYLSPKQIDKGSPIFERYVMRNHRALRQRFAEAGVDLIFHCCGELTDYMVRQFASLDPAILSLGSSRRLWEDSSLVSKQTVLFGNLPSKRFYSDGLITAQEVARLAVELDRNMKASGHPFILGSECDVLSVPGCEATIKAKVEAFLRA
jgi:uroporphyrinogen-III decarboxylase